MMRKMSRLAVLASCTAGAGASAAADALVTFDNGPEGWSINGFDNVMPVGGNPGANIHLFIAETFGIEVRNSSSAEFLGDYTMKGPVRLGIDFDITFIRFFGQDVTREMVVELRDYDNPPEGYPYVSVWYNFGLLPAPDDGWVSYSVNIDDPTSEALPKGWGGYGAEDEETFEPILPADRTFKSVLQSVDQVVFTTFVPGFFFGFTDFDIAIDNVVIESIAGNPADLDGDGVVGSADLAIMLGAWGPCPAPPAACPQDLDNDGACGASDLAIMLGSWGG